MRQTVDIVRVVVDESAEALVYEGVAAHGLGQRAEDKFADAAAHHHAILLAGVARQRFDGKHMVDGRGQIVDRVEQRSVEIEYYESCIHAAKITQDACKAKFFGKGLVITSVDRFVFFDNYILSGARRSNKIITLHYDSSFVDKRYL